MGLLDTLRKYSKEIAIIIVGHHYLKHANEDLTLSDKIFQYDDITNHETWALFFTGIYLGTKNTTLQKYSKAMSITIIGHNYHKHANNSDLSFLGKIVQYDDINNHETWALFFTGIYLGTKKS